MVDVEVVQEPVTQPPRPTWQALSLSASHNVQREISDVSGSPPKISDASVSAAWNTIALTPDHTSRPHFRCSLFLACAPMPHHGLAYIFHPVGNQSPVQSCPSVHPDEPIPSTAPLLCVFLGRQDGTTRLPAVGIGARMGPISSHRA